MKSFLTQLSSHAQTAAVKSITETDRPREARPAIVFVVKAVNKRQAFLRMLCMVVRVKERGGEVVEVTVEFHATEPDGTFHHFLVESLVPSTKWTGF